MTLQSHKKLQTTRWNTHRTKASDRGGRSRWVAGLLLGWLVVTLAADAEAANPRRRGTPLERLKRRSASARWDELRQTWRFDQQETEAASQGAETDETPAEGSVSGTATEPGDWTTESETSDSWSASPRDPSTNPRRDFQVGFEDPAANGFTTRSAQQPASRTAPMPSPEAGHHGLQFPGAKRRSFVAQETMEDESVLDDPELETISSRDVLPKPITEILPYHDYTPNGDDPCEFLCPPPAGCPTGDQSRPCPELVELPETGAGRRYFVDMPKLWEPSNLFHNPLYFEDPALERYGHTHNPVLQPFVSVGKFGTQLVGLPYQMALHPVCERQYVLGWHRPGECVPYRYYFPPWNLKAAATAAGVYTGLIFLIP